MADETVAGARLLVALGTFDPRDDGGLHALIRRFRSGDAAAFATALDGTRAAVEAVGDAGSLPLVVVAVPDHDEGPHEGPRLHLARELARVYGWSAPEPPPLRRVAAIEPAKSRGPRDAGREAASIAWAPAGIDPAAPVLLLDDVLASGRTLEACLAAIRRDDPHQRPVRILVLARARASR